MQQLFCGWLKQQEAAVAVSACPLIGPVSAPQVRSAYDLSKFWEVQVHRAGFSMRSAIGRRWHCQSVGKSKGPRAVSLQVC